MHDRAARGWPTPSTPWRTSAPWPTYRPSAAALPKISPTGSWPGATVRTARHRAQHRRRDAPQGRPALADLVEQLRGDAVLAGEVFDSAGRARGFAGRHPDRATATAVAHRRRTTAGGPAVRRRRRRVLGGVLGAQHVGSRRCGGPPALRTATVAPRPRTGRRRRRVRPADPRSAPGPEHVRESRCASGWPRTSSPACTSPS